jgi:hypothetical protein
MVSAVKRASDPQQVERQFEQRMRQIQEQTIHPEDRDQDRRGDR